MVTFDCKYYRSVVVREKHDLTAAHKSLEDKQVALEAEVEYLRVQVKVGGRVSASADSSFAEFESGMLLALWIHFVLKEIHCILLNEYTLDIIL